MTNTKRTAMKLTARKTNRKRTMKTKNLYCLIHKDELTLAKDHTNHAVNSFLAHGGKETDLKNMVMVKMEVLGRPLVKTTRNITIKK